MDKIEQEPPKLSPYTVRVYAEELEMDHVDYDMSSYDEMSARMLAFCLDGGHAGTPLTDA